jgi:hypothetical protein
MASTQTITVTVEGSDLHLISYYTSEDIRSGKLKVHRSTYLRRRRELIIRSL